MTTPDEIQGAMLAASRELQRLVDAQPALVKTEADASRVCSLAEASAALASSGTVLEREAHVSQACADVRYALQMAKGLAASNMVAIRAAMQRLNALQSIASALREEMKFARTGGGA